MHQKHSLLQSKSVSGNHNDDVSRSDDKAKYAFKFSVIGCISMILLLSLLAMACQVSDHSYNSYHYGNISNPSFMYKEGSRLLRSDKDEMLQSESESDIADFDCGDIFLLASHSQNSQTFNNDERNQRSLLCQYAKNCRSSGWPSRILLPLILCNEVNSLDTDFSSSSMKNATITGTAIATSPLIPTVFLTILLFLPLLLYLFLLFRLLATTADNYFSPSLETFSFELGLPPRFAGATLLALGNGSPDLGSTINAILLWNKKEAEIYATSTATDKVATQAWMMSVGDLIGGGMFVGTIVCGLLVQQCSGIQCRVAFLRDVFMYAFSVSIVWHVQESKSVTQANALGLLGIYTIYVGIVFFADIFHKKVTMERIHIEAHERKKSILEEKVVRLSQIHDAVSVENLGIADELTPFVRYESSTTSYGISEKSDFNTLLFDEDRISDILPSVSASLEKQFPRPRLSVTDRFAMLMSNYDPSSVRHIGSKSTITEESRDSEVGRISTRIHDIRPPLLRAISPLAQNVDDTSTGIAGGSVCEREAVPRHSDILSPPTSDTSIITPTSRSWSWELFVDAYEELVFQSQHFIENSFKRKMSLLEKIATLLEVPFSIARVLTIPLPVEDHYCRPIVALSTACSPIWFIYFLRGNFMTISSAIFILVAFVIALVILRYTDDDKMPLVAGIPLSLYGFFIAATWIDSIGSALVDLLQFFGTFLKIPPGILGMTVLAVGNSMGDLSSNLALAKNGLPNMAATAVFAGPAFNLLVGVGCGFLALQEKLDTSVITPVTLNKSIRTGFAFIIINCIAIAICGVLCHWRVPERYSYVLFAWYALFILCTLLGMIP